MPAVAFRKPIASLPGDAVADVTTMGGDAGTPVVKLTALR